MYSRPAGRKWCARSSERAYVSTCEYGAGSNDMPGHQDLINKMGLTLSERADLGLAWPGERRDFCRACPMSRISSNRTVTGGRVSSAHTPPPCAKRHPEPGNVSPLLSWRSLRNLIRVFCGDLNARQGTS